MQAAPIFIGAALLLLLLRRSTAIDSAINWPIAQSSIKRVGQSVLDNRNQAGNPHYGLDIFANSGTPVLAAYSGTVIRVVDGRQSTKESSQRAGLWVDIRGDDGLIYRYLHLGSHTVVSGQRIRQGESIGAIAMPKTSGLGEEPHLHFEIRKTDFTELRGSYGQAIDPLIALPARSK